MRKITKNAYNAFMNNKKFKSGNTEVKIINDDVITMFLHNRAIIKKESNDIFISDGNYGWSRTTSERLSAFPVRLRGVKGEWILNEKSVWDGKWLKIN